MRVLFMAALLLSGCLDCNTPKANTFIEECAKNTSNNTSQCMLKAMELGMCKH